MSTRTLVCDRCRMKLPSEVHATAHLIAQGHPATIVYLDENNISVDPPKESND